MQAWNNTFDVNNTKPKIAICTPYNGDWKPEWVEKMRDPLKLVQLNWCDKLWFMSKAPSLPAARNSLVNEALKFNADYILFADSDHVMESPSDPNIALNMLYQVIDKNKDSKNGKMVTGLYRAKQKVGFNYAIWQKASNDIKGYSPIPEWTGNWLEIDNAGLGFCLIDIKLFKELPRPWFKWDESEESSEDFYFFEQAKKFGYNLKAFTDVRMYHLGNVKIKTDGTFSIQEM